MKNTESAPEPAMISGKNEIPVLFLPAPATPPKSYAYCSDTAYNETIIPIIRGVDCLFHEATFAESEKLRAKQTLHSTAKQAAVIAQQADVEQLIIGHFSARYAKTEILLKEAREIFKNTLLAEDRKIFHF